MGGIYITHRDRMAQRGRETAAGDDTDLGIAREYLSTFARRQAALERQADPLARRAFHNLAIDALGTGVATLSAAPLVDAEDQPGLDRAGLGREVVAVERQARFEPQRIACAETNRLHLGFATQQRGDLFHRVGGDRNLEPVFAGVAGARDGHIVTGDGVLAELHEGQRGERIFALRMPSQRVRSLGALQRQQRAILKMVERNIVGQLFAQVADIVPLGRAVDHQIEMVRPARDHQVVEHAAIFVEQQRIALLAELQRRKVDRQHGFHRSVEIGAGEQQLAHVRHVEQARTGARPFVLGNDALVLNGHFVARKRHHPRTLRAMPRVESQLFGRSFGLFFAHHSISDSCGKTRDHRASLPPAPSVGIPESLPLRWPSPEERKRFPECSIGARGSLA